MTRTRRGNNKQVQNFRAFWKHDPRRNLIQTRSNLHVALVPRIRTIGKVVRLARVARFRINACPSFSVMAVKVVASDSNRNISNISLNSLFLRCVFSKNHVTDKSACCTHIQRRWPYGERERERERERTRESVCVCCFCMFV